jgi:carbon monoxide dehydrogenase subunit G
MSIRIEEIFQIEAHPDRVWAYLTDPRQVVHCLPGAELTSVQDESTFLGRVKVKVGPITAAYAGKVVLTDRDETNRVVRMTGEGRESGGSGSAKLTMTSTVVGLPTGGTEVRVSADIDIVGRMAQFGRGMIESVNKQMFKQFTDCVRATLASSAETPAGTTAAPVASAPAEPAAESPHSPSAAASPTPPPAAGPSGPPPAWMSVVATPTSGSIVPATMSGAPIRPSGTVTVKPVRLIPVLFRALFDYIGGVLSRLVGRRKSR